MKGQELTTGMIIFAAQLILVFVMGAWIYGVSGAIIDYFTNADSRIIQESVSSFYVAGEISNSSFLSQMNIPASSNILEIGYGNGYYVRVYSEKPTVKISGKEISEVKLAPTQRIPIPSFSNIEIETGAKQFDKDKKTVLSVKAENNKISSVIQ